MSKISRRTLMTTGLALTVGASGLGVATKLAQRYGLIPPDHGGIYGPGETLTYASQPHGTVTEQHLIGPGQCASEELTAGSAFVEPPGLVHSVTNTGNDVAVIRWSTVFPKDDGIVQFSPEFKSGGVYPVTPPNCN